MYMCVCVCVCVCIEEEGRHELPRHERAPLISLASIRRDFIFGMYTHMLGKYYLCRQILFPRHELAPLISLASIRRDFIFGMLGKYYLYRQILFV